MLNISTSSLNLMNPDTKQVSVTSVLICEAFDEQPAAQLFAVCQIRNCSTLLFLNNVIK